jgi:ubiquinone/menaquinone biosynthesis C-methylase UbiE
VKEATSTTDKEYWDDRYEKNIPSYDLSHHFYGRRGLFYRKFAGFMENCSNVIELGCGSSKYLMFFKMVMGLETYGIDFSTTGCEKLEMMAERSGTKHKVVVGDIFQEDMGGMKFDLVFHAGLIEHFKNPSEVVERSRFFCRDDGLLICLLPNFSSKAWVYHSKICPLNDSIHIHYSGEYIKTAIEEKFEIEESGFWGYPQIYAGGIPETRVAHLIMHLNSLTVLSISAARPKYMGCCRPGWASTIYFVCKAK